MGSIATACVPQTQRGLLLFNLILIKFNLESAALPDGDESALGSSVCALSCLAEDLLVAAAGPRYIHFASGFAADPSKRIDDDDVRITFHLNSNICPSSLGLAGTFRLTSDLSNSLP